MARLEPTQPWSELEGMNDLGLVLEEVGFRDPATDEVHSTRDDLVGVTGAGRNVSDAQHPYLPLVVLVDLGCRNLKLTLHLCQKRFHHSTFVPQRVTVWEMQDQSGGADDHQAAEIRYEPIKSR